jgi:putative membrane protein
MGLQDDPEPDRERRGGARRDLEAGSDPDPRDPGRPLVYLAAERTLLTWIRAAIGFVVLGFAVDRFGLLLTSRTSEDPLSSPASSWVGIALIVTGVVASIVSVVRYRRFAIRYARGDIRPGPGLPLAIGLALVLAVVGSGLAFFVWLSIR